MTTDLERSNYLATLPPEQLADLAEHLRGEKASLEEQARAKGDEVRQAEHWLLQKLGQGEVVMASTTGRFAYVGLVSTGKASVNTDAIDEHAADLPPDLRPVPAMKYPSVSQLRSARKRVIAAGLRLGALIREPAKVPGIRWRTLPDESEQA